MKMHWSRYCAHWHSNAAPELCLEAANRSFFFYARP